MESLRQVVTCTNTSNVIWHCRRLTGQNCPTLHLSDSLAAALKLFVLHPSLIDVFCLSTFLNKQWNWSPPPNLYNCAGASLSVITPLKLERGVIVLSVTTVAPWKGVIVQIWDLTSVHCFVCTAEDNESIWLAVTRWKYNKIWKEWWWLSRVECVEEVVQRKTLANEIFFKRLYL